MRVVGYIDGMNFYEASKYKHWYPAGWCNWTETIGVYCPGAAVSVKYFTSLYTGTDQKIVRRQKLHLLAMKEVAKARIFEGSCRQRPLKCPRCDEKLRCVCGCTKRTDEKMTDVNIAVQLLGDAIDGLFERAYLVSSDVDLVPAVWAALARAPKSQIHVLLPPETVMVEEFANLKRDYPDRSKSEYLDLGKMRRFPDDLPRRWNMRLPEHWKKESGKRPDNPEHPPRPERVASWAEESRGYGARDTALAPSKASARPGVRTKK